MVRFFPIAAATDALKWKWTPLLCATCFVVALLHLMIVPALARPIAADAQVTAAIDRAKVAMVGDPQRAFAEARSAERNTAAIANDRDRAVLLATALWLQSEAMLRIGRDQTVDQLVARAIAALETVSETTKLKGDLLLTRGALQIERSRPSEALESFQEAYRVFQGVSEARGQALALQNIAVLYTAAEDFDRAVRYYSMADEAFRSDERLELFNALNRGVLYYQMDRYGSSILESRKAIGLAQKVNSAALEATAAANLARSQIRLERLEDAEESIEQGRRAAETAKSVQEMSRLDTVAAQLAFKRGRLADAAELIQKIFAGVDLDRTPVSLRDAHYTAYKVYSALGDTALALRHLAAERRLDEEASKVAISTSAALMAARFDYANQELRIANLKAEELRRSIAYEREQAHTERLIFGGLAVATVIVLAMLSFGLVTIRRSRNQVREANVILADTNVALEKALRAKTEFLATTSHEIRTPLNGILGMTQVMLADARIEPAMRERIGVVHGAGLTMRSLVDDILDVAKMETGNLTVEMAAMDLPATLRDVCRIWEEQARGKGIGFALDIDDAPVWIESDAGRLRQIVFNLLSNALKFTSAGEVAVVARRAGDEVTIAVSDSGIGIPEDRQADIFESFRQVDAGTTRQFGGTGLGLTICRNLAVALGGDIHVVSVHGQGSTFIVAIPYRPAVGQPIAASLAERCGLAVLDRNPIARSMLKAVLEPRCGSVRFVSTEDELLAMIEDGSVDRILIDEATLKALGDDPIAILGNIAGRARRAQVVSAALWTQPDAATSAAIQATGIGQILVKPIAGSVLADRLLAQPVASIKDRLVSQAA
ncbi:ATP-binding protein [Sphingomonas japonica]|uniref:histidine kinase n=1 Tax=Sphingomonas japonica TaxID=511662 RepID=A0ABX0U148_9SPHN|nr:ATP-binding protein [Sphingomonas japonica]NIJ24299.1 signal transduction histidine kinase/CheY-like chemotaxis protein [Sphingomonas japonica]